MASISMFNSKPASSKTSVFVYCVVRFLLFISSSVTSAWGIEPDGLRKLDEPLYFQFQLAYSSETDFHDSVAFFDYERSTEGGFVTAFSVGRKVADNFLVYPFDVVAYASMQRLDERDYQSDAWGFSVFAKAYHSFDLPYVGLPVRLGFGQGLSYLSRIPLSETRDFSPRQSEKLLYYLDYSLQVSLLHLTRNRFKFLSSSTEDVYIGYSIWHRSTLFGLLGDSTAGINYIGLSIETLVR